MHVERRGALFIRSCRPILTTTEVVVDPEGSRSLIFPVSARREAEPLGLVPYGSIRSELRHLEKALGHWGVELNFCRRSSDGVVRAAEANPIGGVLVSKKPRLLLGSPPFKTN